MSSFFFFTDTASTKIYTLSLHDALPILKPISLKDLSSKNLNSIYWISSCDKRCILSNKIFSLMAASSSNSERDRKSTRLNSSHVEISYAVFCLKKKNNKMQHCIPAEYLP